MTTLAVNVVAITKDFNLHYYYLLIGLCMGSNLHYYYILMGLWMGSPPLLLCINGALYGGNKHKLAHLICDFC